MLFPLSGALTVSGRPVLNLSLALNYAVSGYRPWSYHALNLLIHIGAALALFGIARRTIESIGPAGSPDASPRATWLALASALLWAVHPLTTEGVTYIVQRAESLMALFYLLTLYGFARWVRVGDSDSGTGTDARGGGAGWAAFSVLACLLGTGTKEVIVSAPLAVYLYDRTFVSKSWAGPWRARKGYYLALLASWIPLVLLVRSTGWDRGSTSGFHVGIPWWPYWRSQGEAVARYLGLSFWPHPLVFDYGPTRLPVWQADILFGLLMAAAAATALGCWKGRPWAFLSGLCFMVLAPTSVLPGVLQFVSEHRMYLPLAAVVTWAVVGADAAAERWLSDARSRRRILGAGFAVVAAGFAAATAHRNLIYRTHLGIWQDTIAKRPFDPLAQANVGEALLDLGKIKEGMAYCERSIELDPYKADAHYNLGLGYETLEQWEDALRQYEIAAVINPKQVYGEFRAGRILDRLGKPVDAEVLLRNALGNMPTLAPAHASLGVALAAQGRTDEAIGEYDRALALDPLQPEVEYNLGVIYGKRGQLGEAERHYANAVAIKPDYGDAQLDWGVTLAELGNFKAALPVLQKAVSMLPKSPEARDNLALVLDQLGRTAEAIPLYREALRLRPAYPEAHYNLGNALLKERDLAGAWAEFQEAVRLKPDFGAASDMLDRLRPYLSGQ